MSDHNNEFNNNRDNQYQFESDASRNGNADLGTDMFLKFLLMLLVCVAIVGIVCVCMRHYCKDALSSHNQTTTRQRNVHQQRHHVSRPVISSTSHRSTLDLPPTYDESTSNSPSTSVHNLNLIEDGFGSRILNADQVPLPSYEDALYNMVISEDISTSHGDSAGGGGTAHMENSGGGDSGGGAGDGGGGGGDDGGGGDN